MLSDPLDNLFFKTAVHQCDDFVVITDSEAIVIYVNPSFEKHTGFKLKEIKGKNISIIKSGVHNKTFYKNFWTDLKKGNPISRIFINKNKKGNIYYENKTITPIKNNKGKIEYFLSTSKDFTKEFNLQREVVNQNKFIQSVLKNTDALIVGIDKDGKIVLFNGACEKLTGYKFNEVYGKSVFELFVPKSFVNFSQTKFKSLLAKESKYRKTESIWFTKKNEKVLIKWSNILLNDGKNSEPFVLRTGIDITKEKKHENELKKINSELDEKVKKRTLEISKLNKALLLKSNTLQKINTSLPAIIYYLNVEKKQIILINNQLNDRTVFPLEIDTTYDFKSFISKLNSLNSKTISIRSFLEISRNNEYSFKLNNEAFYLEHKTVVFENDKNNKPIVYLGVLSDITYLKNIQHKLEETQRIAQIGTWVWNIEHNDLFWSNEIYRIFELDPITFKPSYENFLKVIHQSDRKIVEKAVNDSIINKSPYDIIHRLEVESGKIKFVIEKGYCQYDENGKAIKMIGTVRDVTETEYTKRLLEESQKHTKIGSWEYNLITKKLTNSKQLYNIWDLDPSKLELTMDFILKGINKYDIGKVLEKEKEAIETGNSYSVEYNITTALGIQKHVRRIGYVEFNSKGEAVRLFGSVQDITEDWERKNKLLNYYITLENSLSAIFTNDLDGRITHANKAAVQMWGYSDLSEMLKEKPFAYNYWHPDESPKVDFCIKEVLEKGVYTPAEPYRAIKRNGEIALIKINLSIIKDVNDNPVAMTGSFSDVTEEIKNKKEIEENESKLNLLLGNIDEVVYGIEVNDDDLIPGKAFFLSGKSMDIIGYGLKDLQIQPTLLYDSIHPEDYDVIVNSTIKAITQNVSVTREYRMLHRLKKEYYWYEDKITAYTNENGQIVAYYGSIRNITERKRLDLLLIENERKYRSIYENAVVGIFRTNIITQKPIEANNICIKMFAYDTKESFLNEFYASNHYANINDRDKFIEKLKKELFIENQEILFKRKDGTTFWANTSVKIIPDENIMEGVVIDITLRKQYEEQLKRSLEEKDILLKEIHHRVKNNLQVISSLLKLQQHKHSNPLLVETLMESRERIKAIALIHEKMYLSEDISTINFSEYLTNLTKSIYPLYKDKNVKLDLKLGNFITDINTAMPLGLACYEIISNAYKHAFDQGMKGELKISLKKDNGNIYIKIIDNGKGFYIHDIDPTKSLGWSLIKNLVSQAKGYLTITSEINKGSKFHIKL